MEAFGASDAKGYLLVAIETTIKKNIFRFMFSAQAYLASNQMSKLCTLLIFDP